MLLVEMGITSAAPSKPSIAVIIKNKTRLVSSTRPGHQVGLPFNDEIGRTGAVKSHSQRTESFQSKQCGNYAYHTQQRLHTIDVILKIKDTRFNLCPGPIAEVARASVDGSGTRR